MPSPPAQDVTLPPGTRLGPYRIAAFVAAGGMGHVYRATDSRLGRTVAIKLLPSADADDRERRGRFEREARAASALNHPHICSLYDIGCEVPASGDPKSPPAWSNPVDFLVLEFVEGVSLADRLRRGPLPLSQAIELAEQIADALAAAHRRDIVHRDLKPANVMLTASGAKLLDFGIAKLRAPAAAGAQADLTTHETLTRPGTILGTLRYMAPEQLEGKQADARTDLFAFGCVLYEMVTGRRAFDGESDASVISQIIGGEPPAPRALQPALPPLFDRLIRTCLAKDPGKRWQSAHDVAEQLRGFVEAGMAGVSVATEDGRTEAWWRRRSTLVFASIIVVLAAVLVYGVFPRRPNGDTVVPRNITTSLTWDADPALSPEGTQIAYTSGESGNADIYVVPAQGGTPLRVTDDPAWDSSPAWLPNGEIAFVSDRSGHRAIWKVSPGGAPTLLVPDGEDPAVSPDGTRIAFVRVQESGNRRVFVAPLSDVANARRITTDRDGLFDHRGPAWSRDGQTIAYGAQRDVWLVSVEGGNARRLTTDGQMDFEPCWSADGRAVLFTSMREGTQAIWRAAVNGGRPTRVTLGNGPERHPSVSRDGRRLVYATTVVNLDLELRDAQTGQSKRFGTVRSEVQPALSPDARTVYFVSDRQGKFDLWAQPFTGLDPKGPAVRLTDQPGSASMPAASPDGRWIAYGHAAPDNRRAIRVMPVAGGPSVAIASGPFVGEPAWSPDGSRIAFVSSQTGENHIWLVPVSDGHASARPTQVTNGSGSQELPAWSPDGTRIAYVSLQGSTTGDVWIVNARDHSAPTRVTNGAEAVQVRWLAGPDRLLVSGFWGGGASSVRSVTPDGAGVTHVAAAAARSPDSLLFDVSRDGRILVFTAEERHGNVSVFEAASRLY